MVLRRATRKVDGTLKTSSHDVNLEGKFAKLRITPPESDITENSWKAKKKRSRKISSMDIDKSAAKPSDVFPLPIPLDLYEYVKEAIEAMKHPDWSNDMRSVIDLGSAEYKIGVLSRCFRASLPPGWKYERENASSLVAGRVKVFTENGIRYIM